jgi:hypothetical protein
MKIGALVRISVRRIKIAIASGCPPRSGARPRSASTPRPARAAPLSRSGGSMLLARGGTASNTNVIPCPE